MKNIYSQEFMYHYNNQPFNKDLNDYTFKGKDANFSCGDQIEIKIIADKDGEIKDIGYKSDGCIISAGSMSILAEELIGKNIAEVSKLSRENVFELIGIELTPSREKCALVGYNALKSAIAVEGK